MNVEAEFRRWLYHPEAHARKDSTMTLAELVDAIQDGDYSLTLYKKDGYCWSKRGECRVTPHVLEQLKRIDEQPQRR